MKSLLAVVAACFMLTACGEFKSEEKSSNEVLSSLQPYMSEEDQDAVDQLSELLDTPITITDNQVSANTIQVEILGNVVELEIINNGQIAFRLNGQNVTFEDLKKKEVLEQIIMNSIISLNGGENPLANLPNLSNLLDLGFLNNTSDMSPIFRLVLTGIFNFVTATNPALGPIIGTIGNVVLDGVLGNDQQSEQPSIGGGIFGNILGSIFGGLTGNTNTTPTMPNDQNQQQPSVGNTLFNSLLGLFANAILN